MRSAPHHRHYIQRITAAIVAFCSVFLIVCAPAYADSLIFNPTSLRVCVGSTATFTVMHNGGGGTQFTENAASASTSVATVTPASQTTSGANKITPPFTVTGVSANSTQINITDTKTSGNEPVNVNGPITRSPTSLTFSGTTATQNITVTDPGPSVTINANSSDTTVATVTASTTTNASTHQATLTVTPVNGSKNGFTPATATITITDGASCASQTVSVTVSPGTLTLSPTSLTLAGGGTSKSFTGSETDYTGALNALSNNTQIATVSPATGTGPGPVTFNVSPVGTAFGPTTVTVKDDHNGSQNVNVVVTGGTISAGSNTVGFTSTDNTKAHLAGAPITVTGSLQTTSTGTGQIAVSSPGNITGTHGGTLLIGYLTYNCTGNGSGNNQGGAFASGFLQLIASTTATPCVTFPSSQFSNLNFNINLFLDDRALPADNYTGSGFQIVLSAT